MKINFKPTDDDLHKLAGTLITSVTGFILYYFGFATPFVSCLIGFAMGTLAGFAKDYVWDKWMKRGVFDKWDIISTIFGALFGVAVLVIIIHYLNN